MLPVSFKCSLRRRRAQAAIAPLLLLCAFFPAACSKSSAPSATQAKRYHLVGKVVSIDKDQASVMVDGQEIVGFMAAMTMPYSVRDTKLLTPLTPGDEITADVVVDDNGAYLEHIVVTKKGDGKGATGTSYPPKPGDKVPDFVLLNQDGKKIHLRSYQGDVLLVTFIYTRCPYPDFCPLVSRNFSKIYASLKKDPSLGPKVRLLSVSFDPDHDTPEVLRKYAGTFNGTTGGDPFDRWQFAVIPKKDLVPVANFFGLYYDLGGDGQIAHSLSTTVIGPEGRVYKWYQDNDWKPDDLIADAAQAAQQSNPGDAARHAASTIPTA
ncbi:MAG: SCO family protein [Candidatus Acidiferrales bacterium]